MESLFGTDMPLAVRFLVAFVIVLALIGLTFWLIRRFGGTRIGTATARGRQPRLAVIDAAPVDGRRRLVLIRRDNVEHLLLIGGPSDVVVEQNIIRAVPVSAPREMPVARSPGAAEAIATRAANDSTRAAAYEDSNWPAPEPAPRGEARAARSDFLPRPPRNFEPRPESRAMESRVAEPRTFEPSARSTYQPSAATARSLPAFEPQVAPPPIVPEPAPAIDTRAAAPPDDALASMAQRLEAALRRPMPANGRPDEAADTPAPATEAAAEEPAAQMASADAAAPAKSEPRSEAKPARSKTVLDNLEDEMASLLGRPERQERKDS
jgi:flagellar protein FliO/FliZ